MLQHGLDDALITAGADLLKFFGRRPSVAKLGNTAMGSMFLLFASKLAPRHA